MSERESHVVFHTPYIASTLLVGVSLFIVVSDVSYHVAVIIMSQYQCADRYYILSLFWYLQVFSICLWDPCCIPCYTCDLEACNKVIFINIIFTVIAIVIIMLWVPCFIDNIWRHWTRSTLGQIITTQLFRAKSMAWASTVFFCQLGS